MAAGALAPDCWLPPCLAPDCWRLTTGARLLAAPDCRRLATGARLLALDCRRHDDWRPTTGAWLLAPQLGRQRTPPKKWARGLGIGVPIWGLTLELVPGPLRGVVKNNHHTHTPK